MIWQFGPNGQFHSLKQSKKKNYEENVLTLELRKRGEATLFGVVGLEFNRVSCLDVGLFVMSERERKRERKRERETEL